MSEVIVAGMQGIRGQNNRRILVSECGPWNPLQRIAWRQLKEAEVAVGDPQIPRGVLGEGAHEPAGSRGSNKPVLLHVADPGQCGDPGSPLRVLKKRTHPLIRQSAVGNLSHAGAAAVPLTDSDLPLPVRVTYRDSAGRRYVARHLAKSDVLNRDSCFVTVKLVNVEAF